MEYPTPDFVSTGVPGLDAILCGGFLKNGFYLIQGDPGSGKTTLALQYLLEGASRQEKGLYISLTETMQDLERTCQSHRWDLSRIEVADLTRSQANLKGDSESSIFYPSEFELAQVTAAIIAEVERVNPRHVVFDGLSEMRLLAERPLRYRHQMLALKQFFEDRNINVLLLDDRSNPMDNIQPESIVGGNIAMERYLPGYGGGRRRLHISKVRGSSFLDGYHDYEIVSGGLLVHPRLVAHEHQTNYERALLPSGIANLDNMVNGGLELGTTALLIGPAGAGKSTIAMQYVVQHLVRGGRAAVYLFDEVLATFFERSEKLCYEGIRQYAESGSLVTQQVNPAQLSPGAFAQQVRRAVEEDGIKIVVIDSLNGYMNSMPEERFLSTHLHELFAYLNQRGVLTIVVVAQHGLLGSMEAEVDVSYLADTVLLLRYFETSGEIRQAISVFKKRTGIHERTLRELRIRETGVEVGPPLTDFQGIMTGVPEYRSSAGVIREKGESPS